MVISGTNLIMNQDEGFIDQVSLWDTTNNNIADFFIIIFLLAISFFFVCLFVCLGFFSPHFSVIFFLLASVPSEAIYPSCSLPHLQLSTKVHNICYAFLSCSGYHLKDMTISCIFRMPDIQHTHAFLLG